MAIVSGLTEVQVINPIRTEATPKSSPKISITEHRRRPFDVIKRFLYHKSEARNQAQEIQLGDDLTNQIRGFDRAVSILKKIKDPEVLGIIAAGAIGALGIIIRSSELGQVALMAGGAVVGAGVGKGPKEKIIGAVAGATAGVLVSEGLHNIPVDHNTASATLSVGDDLLVPVGKGVVAGLGKIKANR